MMTKLASLQEEFAQLSHEDKEKKLIAILEYIQDKADFTQGILGQIKEHGASDEFIMQVYGMIMKATIISNDQAAQEYINKIIAMKEEEQQQKQQDDQEAENILASI